MNIKAKIYADNLIKAVDVGNDDSYGKMAVDFASLLYEEGMTSLISDIKRYYEDSELKKTGKIRAIIQTADDMNSDLKDLIDDNNVLSVVEKDASLLSGVRIKIGDNLIENSISRRIKNLKKAVG